MANFGRIQQDILEEILQFLPLRDKINSGFVCAHWNEVVGFNLNDVTIDPSMPFGGRWVEENMRWIDHGSRYKETCPSSYREESYMEGLQKVKVWYRDENDPADKEMKKLIPMLCKLTNKIKTLNIENYHLDTESLTELFASQTEIKTLRIKMRNLPAWVKNVYFEKIVEVIIKHQETIEVIEIKIETAAYWLKMFQASITNIQGIITCKGRLRFPRLISLKLTDEAYSAINQLSNDLFKSLIASSQLEELEFRDYQDILPYIKNGNLGRLKKLSLEYYQKVAEELINHCPNITHLDGYQSYAERWHYARCVLQIISTYGPQLKSLECWVVRRETANAIFEECKNLESLVLYFRQPAEEGWIDESLAIKSSIPLFGYLKKLTKMELWLMHFEVEAEIVCELLERCGMNLQSFILHFRGFGGRKIVNAVGANCKNLTNLRLNMVNKVEETERGTTNDISMTRERQESVETIREGCQKLRTLYLDVSGWSDEEINLIIYDQMGKKQPNLQYLELVDLFRFPTPIFVKLIHAFPYCNIEKY